MTSPCFLSKIAQINQKWILFFPEKKIRDRALVLTYLDSPMDKFILQTFYYFQFGPSSWGNGELKIGKKVQTLVPSCYSKTIYFPKISKSQFTASVLPLVKVLAKLDYTWESRDLENPQNLWMLNWYAKLWTFVTRQPQVLQW